MSDTNNQYDSIGPAYDEMETLPYRILEEQNTRRALEPLLEQDVSILEFASGGGYYTSRLLDWGASTVTAIDISSVMCLQARNRMSAAVSAGRVRFVVADGSQIQSFSVNGESQGFDVAFGAWFLNYAKCKEELTSMFACIAHNLKFGGVFVGIVPHPCNNLDERGQAFSHAPMNRMFPRNEYGKVLPKGEGRELRVFLNDEGVDFLTWHLKKDIYEEAARAGGMNGRFEWKLESTPDSGLKAKFDLSEQEWKIREMNPHLGILVVWKD